MSLGWDPGQIAAERIHVADNVRIAPSARIRAREVYFEEGVTLGEGVSIRAGRVALGRGTRFVGDTSVIFVDSLEIGPVGYVDKNCVLRGRWMQAGSHLYIGERVTIGGGGAMGHNSTLVIGDATSIFSETYVNLSEAVRIGSGTALSGRVTVLTHGCWQPVLKGYPSSFAPVHIGNEVMVYLGSTVLPGCHIGNGALIGANSLVNRSIPDHCHAAGNPVKIIRKNYPPAPGFDAQRKIILKILQTYAETLDYKGFEDIEDRIETTSELLFTFKGQPYRIILDPSQVDYRDAEIAVIVSLRPFEFRAKREKAAHFDLSIPAFSGYRDEVIEDIRDYFRRTGIRIMDDQPFHPIPPAGLKDLVV